MPSKEFLTMRNTIAIAVAIVMIFLGAFAVTGLNPIASYGADEDVIDDPNYMDRQVVVTFNDDVDKAAAADIVAFAVSEELISENNGAASGSISSIRNGISLTKIKTDTNTMLVGLSVDIDEEAAADEIEKNPDVSNAQPNYIYTMTAGDTGSADYENGEWYLDYIDAEQAWDLIDEQTAAKDAALGEDVSSGEDTEATEAAEENAEAAGTAEADEEDNRVVVALLDTGIDKELEGLADVDITASRSSEVKPLDNHGSEMAGLVAATASNATVKILDVDIFNNDSENTLKDTTTTADIIAGIDYACRHDARIVTMAFGRHGFDKALNDKMKWAKDEEDVLIVVAAGDAGSADSWNPADMESCLSCINTLKYDNAYGQECRNGSSNYSDAKTISAPGTWISVVGAGSEPVSKTGTSYSAAIVAGTAAMVMYADPELSAEEVSVILQDTATDIGASGFDIQTASGNVNAYKAVAKAYAVKAEPAKGDRPGQTAVKAKASEEGITLTWKDVEEAGAYVIYRKGSGDDNYIEMDSVSGDVNSWTDEYCNGGKTYMYRVAAGKTSADGKKLTGKMSDPAKAKALDRKE